MRRHLIGGLVLIALAITQVTQQQQQQQQANKTIANLQTLAANGTTSQTTLQILSAQNLTATSSEQLQEQVAGNLTESLNERLVKQSNLQAEESQQSGAVIVEAPPLFASASDEARPQRVASSSFVSDSSYMSMAHDGSNRYEFGFDTKHSKQQQQQQQPLVARSTTNKKPPPRLMREESRLEDGTVIGRYGYTDPFNVFRIVQYVAGPDGYFASEDVGGLQDSTPSEEFKPGSVGGRPKFQLNKQLHRALEQALALRHSRQSKKRLSPLVDHKQQQQQQQQQQPDQITKRTDEQRLQHRERADADAAELLSGSSSNHQSVRFATRINHVVGTNGVTYATAFRPTMATALASPALEEYNHREQQHQLNQPSQESQATASATRPVYVSTRYEPVLDAPNPSDIYRTAASRFPYNNNEQLRSLVPAPIYSPPDSEVENSYGPHANDREYSSAKQLQSHPAWTLLNNNYNGNYQTSLFIDHAKATKQQQPIVQVGQTFQADQNQEAQLLAGLSNRRGQQSQRVVVPTPNLASQYQTQAAAVVLPVAAVAPSQSAAAHKTNFGSFNSFGTRNGLLLDLENTNNNNQQQHEVQQPSYNYGFALKHFDAPLYHPEVHETRLDSAPVAAVQSQATVQTQPSSSEPRDHRSPSFQYATTIVHSEVAAEQNYRPERLSHSQRQQPSDAVETSPSELIQRDASEVAANVQSRAQPKQAETTTTSTTTVPPPPQAGVTTSLKRQPRNQKNVAYATRLSSAAQTLASGDQSTNPRPLLDEELFMEDSEQVGYLPNGTQTQHPSRARMPDRSKKLSSIFKARNSAQQGEPQDGTIAAAGGQTAAASSASRIRKPMPANAKRQQHQSSSNARVESAPVSAQAAVEHNAEQKLHRDPVVESATQFQQLTSFQMKPTSSGKKFGAHLRSHGPQLDAQLNVTEEVIVHAKKRPMFVDPTKRQQPAATAVTTEAIAPAEPATAPQANRDLEQPITKQKQPRAMIVDTMTGLNSQIGPNQLVIDGVGGANRELVEKIMRIQKEIASKSSGSKEPKSSDTTPLPVPLSTTTTSTSTSTTPTITTSSITTPPPTTTTTTKNVSTTVTSPATTTTTTTTTTAKPTESQPAAATTATKRPQESAQQTSGVTLSQPKLKLISELAATKGQPDQVLEGNNFLTGPLVKMDPSASEQEDFMMNLVRDMVPFDSARAVVMSDTNAKLTTVAGEAPRPSTARPTTTTSTTQAPAKMDEPTREPAQNQTLPESLQTTTTRKPAQLVSSSAEVQPKPAATATTTTAAPVQTRTTTPKQTSSTTIAHQQRDQRRTTSQPARFGRLVIKRGDTVVARYNASDSIPDSMIPTSMGGSGELIMPDMPRLGMRRASKKRVQKQEQQQRLPTTTSTSTTLRPAAAVVSLSSSAAENVGGFANPSKEEETRKGSETTTAASLILSKVQANASEPSSVASSTAAPHSVEKMKNETGTVKLEQVDHRRAQPITNQKRTLLRGARSSGHEEPVDLEASESRESSAFLVVEPLQQQAHVRSLTREQHNNSNSVIQTTTPIAARQASSATVAGRPDWSSRLRGDIIGRQQQQQATVSPNNNKKYDPNEDLKKLVEKIERIQFESPSGGASRQGPFQQPGIATPSTPKPIQISISREQKQANTTVIAQQQQQQRLNSLRPNGTVSQSSSISFTVTVSPDIESQWRKLKPVNVSQLSNGVDLTNMPGANAQNSSNLSPTFANLLTKLSSSNATAFDANSTATATSSNVKPKLDVRVDSHGHIHVRNNQSITVHVDIEPPKRDLSTSSSKQQPLVGIVPKRISSRDTSAASSKIDRRDDIQRVRQSTSNQQVSKPANPFVNSNASQDKIRDAGAETSDVNLLNRKPRMLCIEVESNDSDLRRQKAQEDNHARKIQTKFSPDV